MSGSTDWVSISETFGFALDPQACPYLLVQYIA